MCSPCKIIDKYQGYNSNVWDVYEEPSDNITCIAGVAVHKLEVGTEKYGYILHDIFFRPKDHAPLKNFLPLNLFQRIIILQILSEMDILSILSTIFMSSNDILDITIMV